LLMCDFVKTNADFSQVKTLLEFAVTSAFGFKFKNASTDVRLYKDVNELKSKGLLVPFLSSIVVPEGSGYVSVPIDINKFSCSWVLSGAFKKTNELRLNIILGTFFSGAWYDENWLIMSNSAFKHFYSSGVTTETVAPELDDGLVCMLHELGVTFSWGLPSREYMVDFHQMSRVNLTAKWGQKWNNDEPLNVKVVKKVKVDVTLPGAVKASERIVAQAVTVANQSKPVGGGDSARNKTMALNNILNNSVDVETKEIIQSKIISENVTFTLGTSFPTAPSASMNDLFDGKIVRVIDVGNPTALTAEEAKAKQERYIARRTAKNKARDEFRAAIKLLANKTLNVAVSKFVEVFDQQDVGTESDEQQDDEEEEAPYDDEQEEDKLYGNESVDNSEREYVESDEFGKAFGYIG